ncbi:MAG: ABC transporter ATP-binding protein [Planctomycetes bacterium]|nr:ABC transporter ATP-binding protein [Planctomycetota bacterium]
MGQNGEVLKVRNLSTHFYTGAGVAKAVQKVDLTLKRGRTLGLVGESGCGKSVTALSIMRLVPEPPGRIVAGRVELDGRNLLELSEAEMRSVRGSRIAMIFQEPMTSLNPVFTVGSQIVEAVRVHERLSRTAARDRAVEMLSTVRIPNPAQRMRSYPHQLSGGQQQRVMIAMALACGPDVLIADEPTTALDVTIQSQILSLLDDLQARLSMAVLFITHDMAVIAQTADDVAVMYAGTIVERAPVKPLFNKPLHPYTRLLFRSIPTGGARGSRLETIAGQVPSLLALPTGCRFHPRCPLAFERCVKEEPVLREVEDGRLVACHRAGEIEELMK